MTIQEHYQRGFMAKCAQAGLSQDDVAKIVSELGTQFGSNGLDDNKENDYGAGIADSIRNIWTPSEVMAKKQRRFENNYKKKGGLGKIWEQIKHPVRSMRADGTSGAMGMTAAGVAVVLAHLLASRAANKQFQRQMAANNAAFEARRLANQQAFEARRLANQQAFEAHRQASEAAFRNWGQQHGF